MNVVALLKRYINFIFEKCIQRRDIITSARHLMGLRLLRFHHFEGVVGDLVRSVHGHFKAE